MARLKARHRGLVQVAPVGACLCQLVCERAVALPKPGFCQPVLCGPLDCGCLTGL